jgi:hypothetical protein
MRWGPSFFSSVFKQGVKDIIVNNFKVGGKPQIICHPGGGEALFYTLLPCLRLCYQVRSVFNKFIYISFYFTFENAKCNCFIQKNLPQT